MKHLLLLILNLFLILTFNGCRKQPEKLHPEADAIVIFSASSVFTRVRAEAVWGKDPQGRSGMTISMPFKTTYEEWVQSIEIPIVKSVLSRPGTIFVCRDDMVIRGEQKLAGRSYHLKGGKLEEIGKVDLNQTDEQIATQFGIE